MSLVIFMLIFIHSYGEEVLVFDSGNTSSSDWLSVQNDGDGDGSVKKWSQVGSGFLFYVCRIDGILQDNWLRSPFIWTAELQENLQYVYVHLKYSLSSCASGRDGVERVNCQQTFYLHYKESNNTDEGDAIDEYDYNKANKETPSIVPQVLGAPSETVVPIRLSGNSQGIYLAIRDRGACITLTDVTVWYRYCPEIVSQAARYNKTVLAGTDEEVIGQCVDNASTRSDDIPTKYCWESKGNGEWEKDRYSAPCLCNRGYEMQDNMLCVECRPSFYKRERGNKKRCISCPPNSISVPGTAYQCDCLSGFRRANVTNLDDGCIAPPAPPDKSRFELVTHTGNELGWDGPALTDGLEYRLKVSKKDDGIVTVIEVNKEISNTSFKLTDLEPGQEYIIALAIGNGSVEGEPIIFIEKTHVQIFVKYGVLLMVVIGVLVVALFGILAFYLKRRSNRRQKNGFGEFRDPMLDHGKTGTISSGTLSSYQHRKYVPISMYTSEHDAIKNAMTIDRSFVVTTEKCGQGQFGEVWKGVYQEPGGGRQLIAAKILREGATLKQKRDFLFEAAIMSQFEDPNVIHLVGVVKTCDPIMIITEYMENGSLKDYLKEIKGSKSVAQLLSMARGIVSGMRYLAEMNYIHRDLAARNVLVNEHEVCKVADFGLSRVLEEDSLYYQPQRGQIPIRWTAPEAIQHRKYTQSSDAYSFGVLLWEIMTYGAEPWGSVSNDVVLEYLKERRKLPQPTECPKCVYDLMKRCWQEDGTKRPTFATLLHEFDSLILNNVKTLSSNPSVTTDTDDEVISVQTWLDQMKLGHYQSHFINTGWDSMDKVLLMTTEDLQNIGVTLPGHQKKIMAAINYVRDYHCRTFPGIFTPDSTLARHHSTSSANTLPSNLKGFPTT